MPSSNKPTPPANDTTSMVSNNSTPGLWTERIIPSVVFPAVSAVTMYFMVTHFLTSGTNIKLAAQCSSSPLTAPAYFLPYTGIAPLDVHICALVTFSQMTMDESTLPFFTEFFVSFATLVTIPYMEAARNGRSAALSLPLIVGLLCQSIPVGLVMPLYWLVFVWTGASSLHKRPVDAYARIGHGHAEGTLFALVIAYFIPTAAMISLDDAYVTAIWHSFPILMSAADFGHRLFRPSSESGYNTVRATYIILFIITSSYHISIVWPKFGDYATFKFLFIPSLHPLDPSATPLGLGILNFLKWDAAGAYVSSILVTFWFSRNLRELLVIVLWCAIAVPAFGPGATIAGAFLWRETVLQAQRQSVDKNK